MKDFARRKFHQGAKPPTIARELAEAFPEAERLPDERAVRYWTKKWGVDQTGPWKMGEIGDPAILLPVLRALIEATNGKITELTNAEAEELTHLGRAVHGMPAIGMYNWARAMVAARETGVPVAPLLHYLVFSPWTDGGKTYLTAFGVGWIDEMRGFCPDDETWLDTDTWRRRGGFSVGAVIVGRE